MENNNKVLNELVDVVKVENGKKVIYKLPKESEGCIHDWHKESIVLFPVRMKHRCSKCDGYTYADGEED